MMRLTVICLLAALAVGCRSRNKPSKQGEDVEGTSPVAMHPEIDNRIRAVKHHMERTPDGRLAVAVTIESRAEKDMAVITTMDWFAEDGRQIERSDSRNILIPRGGTIVYKDSAFSPEAASFHLALRPASTKRKR